MIYEVHEVKKRINIKNSNKKTVSMKKNRITAVALSLLVLGACHKESNPSDKTGDGYWTLIEAMDSNGVVYTRTYPFNYTARSSRNGYTVVSGIDTLPTLSHNTTDSLNFWFLKLPSANIRYRIVNFSDTTRLKDDEVGVTLHHATWGTYSSSGFISNANRNLIDSINVTITGGKIKIDIPEIAMYINNAFTLDSLQLLGNVLIEK